MKRIGCAAAFCLSIGATVQAAEPYPSRPVRMIAPFPPAGPTDVLARTIALGLTLRWGQQVVVDNRPGAAGNIGTELAARAPADGYTLLMGTVATHAINENLYSKLPFAPRTDFAAVALAAQTPSAVVVHPGLAATTFAEFMALAKVKGPALNYAHAGVGTIAHLAMELLSMQSGVQVTLVAYKGTGPALTDTIAGQTHFMISSTLTAMPHVKNGKLRALAVTSARRSVAMPDLPTVAESGLPNYVVVGWAGVFAPARVPKTLIEQLNREINAVLAVPNTRERLLASGAETAALSATEFARFAEAETARWAAVVKTAAIKSQ